MKNETVLKLDLFFGDITSSSVEDVSQEEISAFANVLADDQDKQLNEGVY